jgi:O-acetyl-ADP-ribose deacetylase (regulator of RNase III)
MSFIEGYHMLKYRYDEDMFNSKNMALVNTINCMGIMGVGIAKEFKLRYPDMFSDYEKKCAAKEVKIGKLYIYPVNRNRVIINFPTKNHWRYRSRIKYIEEGLKNFATRYKEWKITSVAFPQLGCGNGGLIWSEVKPLMEKYLANLDIDIEIYVDQKREYVKELTDICKKLNSQEVKKLLDISNAFFQEKSGRNGQKKLTSFAIIDTSHNNKSNNTRKK